MPTPVTFFERLADGTALLAPPGRRAFMLPAGWTWEDHPTDSLASAAGGLGEVTGYVKLVAPTIDLVTGAQVFPAQITTDATLTTVATIPTPVPAGGTLYFEGLLLAVLAPGGVNANFAGVTAYKIAAAYARAAGGSTPMQPDPSAGGGPSAPFIGFGKGPSHGTAAVAFSSNQLVVNVIGFAVKEAWTSGHTYTAGDASSTPGDFVTANGNVYCCTGIGTASGSAPSGTGIGLGTGATFTYVGPGTAIPVEWQFTLTLVRTLS